MIGWPFCIKFKKFNNTVTLMLGIFHALQLKSQKLFLAELDVYVFCKVRYKVSYRSAHVLLNLLKELREK